MKCLPLLPIGEIISLYIVRGSREFRQERKAYLSLLDTWGVMADEVLICLFSDNLARTWRKKIKEDKTGKTECFLLKSWLLNIC